MNANLIDLPAAPVVATLVESPLQGAGVEARLMDGSTVQGALQALQGDAGMLSLVAAADTEATRIPFDKLRYLRFIRPYPVPPGPHPAKSRGDVVQPQQQSQSYHIVFQDGEELTGQARSATVDPIGLHIFQADTEHTVHRLFVPTQAVRSYRFGAMLGELLVSSKKTGADLVKAALNKQQQGRQKRIGEYLTGQQLVSSDQLRELLERQASYIDHTAEGAKVPTIGRLLLDDHLITQVQLDDALAAQQLDRGKKLGELLEDMGIVSNQAIQMALAHKFGIPMLNLRHFDIDPGVLDALPADIARKHRVIPLFNYRGRLVVSIADPADSDALDVIRFIVGKNIELTTASRQDIDWALSKYYGFEEDILAAEERLQVGPKVEHDATDGGLSAKEVERLGREKPIVRLVNRFIMDAIEKQASDIHIRALEDKVNLIMRINGTLVHLRSFNKSLLPAVVSRIKIIGGMDIVERRLPQDGGTRISHNDNVVDLRISVIPTVTGESVVIRLLNTQMGLKKLAELGFSEHDRELFTDMLHRSYGIVLVTGPTGSGKSTTLYAALQEIRSQNVNIITVEDPVEYHVSGIEQIQTNAVTGLNFAKALRHILRHDPDVIMVGEIRDVETAKMAVESALTGHLVLSTLHTNDAASTITRLLEMGEESYLLTATLLGVLAQRLVRVNCSHCSAPEEVEPLVRKVLGVSEDEVFYKGQGCDYCDSTGYSGRMAVYELLQVSPAIRELVAPGATSGRLHDQAVSEGMVPLTQNALVQARQRRISLAEVYRVRLQ